MKKIILVGNPNVGKSLLFSRMTGIKVVTANYAGTTVDITSGHFKYKRVEYEIFDAPGSYSLSGGTKTDEAVIKLIEEGDIIINVLDSTNLERNLNLTLQLLKINKPMILCLNLWEDTVHKGIQIDVDELSKILDLEVIKVSALENDGVSDLVEAIEKVKKSNFDQTKIEENKLCSKSACGGNCEACNNWSFVGYIISKVQKLTHKDHTVGESISDFTLHPIGGLLTAIIVLISVLFIVRLIGESVTNYILTPFYGKIYAPFIMNLSERYLHFEFIKGLLVGYSADPLESFGILTSGVYIALVLVFPYFFSFYFIFGFLEDVGYLPRLAVVLDNLFHKLGLHGSSSIPVMLGLGCKVPAIMSTRVLSTNREKILTVALILMAVPCLPQTAMIIALGIKYGIHVVIMVFGILALLSVIVNSILNKVLKGETTDLFMEIPSYRMPSVRLMASKLKKRIADYFAEVLPLIIAGVFIMNLLQITGVIDFVTKTLKNPVHAIMGLPPDIASIMLLGFLRKDVSIALLAPLNLSASQFVVASVFLVLYIPCISTFFTLIKELGIKSAAKVLGVVFVSATTVAFLLNLIFSLNG